jgi:signal transduction histidine kinase
MGLQLETDTKSEQGGCAEDRADVARVRAVTARGELARVMDHVASLESTLARQAQAHADSIHLLSHELRTPITVITGFSRLLLDPANGELSERQERFVQECLKACRRLDRLVGDLVDASLEAGSVLRVEAQSADLDETIRSTIESLSTLVSERGMHVDYDFAREIPSLVFDPARIEQVVTNLMTNAIRYGAEGGSIRVGRRPSELDGKPAVIVWIEDDGPGIPESDRERVFQPYTRGSRPSVCSGMGIGLAICERIVASHSGSIRVEDGSNGGARFIFSLPAAPCAAQE